MIDSEGGLINVCSAAKVNAQNSKEVLGCSDTRAQTHGQVGMWVASGFIQTRGRGWGSGRHFWSNPVLTTPSVTDDHLLSLKVT